VAEAYSALIEVKVTGVQTQREMHQAPPFKLVHFAVYKL
jgi:hypothetical protein